MKLKTLGLRAFTLAELTVAAGLSAVLGLVVVNFLGSSSLLMAKNVSTNLTHSTLRISLDRIVQHVSEVNGALTLVNINGGVVSSGNAAGVRFDHLVGYPYVVLHPGGSGLQSSATTLTLRRSKTAQTSPPIPENGDVLLLDGATNIRLKVLSATAGAVTGTPPLQNITVTLKSPVGITIPWSPNTAKTAKLVRAAAYVVVPNGPHNELRFFPSAEGITNFAGSTSYSMFINNIGVAPADKTPFSFVNVQGRNFLRTNLSVRSTQYENRLSNKEARKFSAVNRADVLVIPRGSN